MTAMESLLAGLVDYAGLYPPAALDMHTALSSYTNHGRSKHASALGRFLVDANRIADLHAVAGDSARHLKVSLIASPSSGWQNLARILQEDLTIDSIEIRIDKPSDVAHIGRCIPPGLTIYIEVPFNSHIFETLEAINTIGACAKLRMGGLTAGAFPASPVVASMLKALADRRMTFKATAGLHHPIRSHHPFTYEPDSPSGIMHGFINLVCAAALIYYGADISQVTLLLDDQNPTAWHITPDCIAWRSFQWTTEELRLVREKFMTSFGSCSFSEPMHDLEALGWL